MFTCSLDAKSTNIQISAKCGGLKFLQVSVRRLFDRHVLHNTSLTFTFVYVWHRYRTTAPEFARTTWPLYAIVSQHPNYRISKILPRFLRLVFVVRHCVVSAMSRIWAFKRKRRRKSALTSEYCVHMYIDMTSYNNDKLDIVEHPTQVATWRHHQSHALAIRALRSPSRTCSTICHSVKISINLLPMSSIAFTMWSASMPFTIPALRSHWINWVRKWFCVHRQTQRPAKISPSSTVPMWPSIWSRLNWTTQCSSFVWTVTTRMRRIHRRDANFCSFSIIVWWTRQVSCALDVRFPVQNSIHICEYIFLVASA